VTRSAESRGVAGALAELIDHSARVSRELMDAFAGDTAARAGMATRDAALAVGRQVRGCCCDIPPPCWMPEQLGNLTSHACPGATVRVCLRITNCGISPRDVTVTAGGPQAALVTIDPPSIAVGPFDSGTVAATITAPDQACEPLHAQLWVHGCRDHLLRWTVDVSRHGCSCTHEIEIDDCPDLIHHWYDHFYCERPCPCGAERGHA
jgi:hypothetical protein